MKKYVSKNQKLPNPKSNIDISNVLKWHIEAYQNSELGNEFQELLDNLNFEKWIGIALKKNLEIIGCKKLLSIKTNAENGQNLPLIKIMCHIILEHGFLKISNNIEKVF